MRHRTQGGWGEVDMSSANSLGGTWRVLPHAELLNLRDELGLCAPYVSPLLKYGKAETERIWKIYYL
jgi:hypothetical protein